MIMNTSGAAQDSMQCLLVQLPGNMPFKNLEQHDGKAMLNLPGGNSPAVSGKLRVFKSGKVVMRFTREDGTHIDMNVNKGIKPSFY